MAYLDISPMLVALREQPAEFELKGAKLRHVPSRHTFGFTSTGRAVVTRTRCDCAALAISERQSAELKAALGDWTVSYWEPMVARQAEERRVAKINRNFAAHFNRRGLQRMFDRFASLWRAPDPDIATSP